MQLSLWVCSGAIDALGAFSLVAQRAAEQIHFHAHDGDNIIQKKSVAASAMFPATAGGRQLVAQSHRSLAGGSHHPFSFAHRVLR